MKLLLLVVVVVSFGQQPKCVVSLFFRLVDTSLPQPSVSCVVGFVGHPASLPTGGPTKKPVARATAAKLA